MSHSNTAKILIVGCGQLGSRHLQSLALVERNLEIHIVDPFQESLDKAQVLFKASESFTQNLVAHSSLSQIKNSKFDITINASTSQGRLDILRSMKQLEILSDFIVLEKVLFQNLTAYDEAQRYMNESKTWVNCPRRMYPFYQDLKLTVSGPVHAKFQAANWGLCCNSVHYIDLLQYLTNEKPIRVNTNLKNKVYPTKREGYIEFYGTISVEFNSGSQLELICTEEPCEWQLEIKNDKINYISQEVQGISTLNQKSIPIRAPYQSELTAIFVEQFLSSGSCDLPTYSESKLAHTTLIDSLLSHYQKITKTTTNTLPIT